MSALLPVINHLIAQNRETQAGLAEFSGKSFSMQAAGLHIHGILDDQGFLKPDNGQTDTQITFRPTAIQKILQGQTPGIGDVGISGDTRLGMALLPLIGSLRYYAQDDLSRLLGDNLASNIGTRTAHANRLFKQMGQSVLEQLGEFAREPESPVPDRETLAAWAAEVDTLRDDTSRLEARLAKLEKQAAEQAEATHPNHE
ncbi:ubiquinone biosynthesis accessory factor UbiJ [Neisseria zalophi]|uniref:SCP2 domain-containing protein n=1 Tax=Neisseria zalophi TaxID=640030 RepID=A0A5J6PWH9_9NEIS|nr:SCP2 domain-containing protein [Neisseria zalophi]QEY26925.1 SCP2 domain-containing protein [Neisseria zalophi]